MDPLFGASLLQTGGGILGGLASYFGGGDERKKRDQLYRLGLGMLGKDVYNPTQYLSQYSQGLGSQMSPYESQVQRRFGLDSGVGASEVLKARQGLLSNFLTEGWRTNALAKTQRDQSIMGLLSGLYRG